MEYFELHGNEVSLNKCPIFDVEKTVGSYLYTYMECGRKLTREFYLPNFMPFRTSLLFIS